MELIPISTVYVSYLSKLTTVFAKFSRANHGIIVNIHENLGILVYAL